MIKNNRTFFSTLWIFVTFNYLYCDLIGLMDAHLLKQYLAGVVEGIQINERFLLYAGILMEIPIAMILLSQVLSQRINAMANMVAAFIKTAVMLLTLFIGTFTSYYFFFAVVEISTTVFIFYRAFLWLRKTQPNHSGFGVD